MNARTRRANVSPMTRAWLTTWTRTVSRTAIIPRFAAQRAVRARIGADPHARMIHYVRIVAAYVCCTYRRGAEESPAPLMIVMGTLRAL